MTTLPVTAGGGSSGPATPSPELNVRHGHSGDAPQQPPQQPPQQQQQEPVLTFTDVSSDLFQLQLFGSATSQPNNAAPATSRSSPSPQSPRGDSSTAPTASTTPSAAHHPQARRPSPGLAARLRALGFGAHRKHSPPPPHLDHIGRLPEEQIRRLEAGHQASSAAPVIERRGRTWKGVIARTPSRPGPTLVGDAGRADAPDVEDIAPAHDEGGLEPNLELLPEIATPRLLEMDTYKYRLPDHTNGNGVKVQRETREEHLARDTRPPQASDFVFGSDPASYFNPLGLQRPGSIYTLSRVSFTSQLAQLTSIQLPDAESLSGKVSAIPTAQAATKALIGAADQIRGWIHKATEVVGGLESDDDVEWAAAGGREGVEEVENAIVRFEELIHVYVSAIEDLQGRGDIAEVPADDLTQAVVQMESILDEWCRIRATLRSVKAQVEIAMEWEELWDMVLGDIQNEMDELSRLVFEMEERRHKSIMAATGSDGVDIGDLETIVEETPPATARLQAAAERFGVPGFPASPSSPSPSAAPAISQDDSSLLALFARMQPLRASLDFLPMRLSVFDARARRIFPTACEELETRTSGLDAGYKKLEKDAESLRKELGEDRWVLVFRGAGRQAQKMYESVERSAARLREAVDAGMHLTNQPGMGKKMEAYEAKKTHYGPAIERVLAIIDKGVKDRLTVNGEILRLHTEMQAKWEGLKERMAEMDLLVDDMQAERRGQKLRDSVSSMLSIDRSTAGSANETPGSSPPSSVIMSGLGLAKSMAAAGKMTKPRSASGGSHLPQPVGRRNSSLPTPPSQGQRRPLTSRFSSMGTPSRDPPAAPALSRIARLGPGPGPSPSPSSALPGRPRWNSSTNTADVDTGHNFKPLSLTTPSPYAKQPPTPVRPAPSLTPSSTKLPPPRSALSRATSASPIPEATPSKRSSSCLSGARDRIASPARSPQQAPARPPLRAQTSMSSLATRRASMQPRTTADAPADASADASRPASSMAAARRTSMLPQPRSASRSAAAGRESPQAVAGARSAMRNSSAAPAPAKPKDNRPRWRA